MINYKTHFFFQGKQYCYRTKGEAWLISKETDVTEQILNNKDYCQFCRSNWRKR